MCHPHDSTVADGQFGVNRSGYFNQYNQGKLSVALDLKDPRAIGIAKDLIAKSDIVCENFSAGVMDRLDWATVRYARSSRHHHDRHVRIWRNRAGTRVRLLWPGTSPLSGMSSLTGYAGWPPMHVGVSYGDPTAGLHGAFAVLAALLHRASTARGNSLICRSRRRRLPSS